MADAKDVTNDLSLDLSPTEEVDILSAVLRAGREPSTGNVHKAVNPRRDPTGSQAGTFSFLDFPYEIRVLIYIHLFSLQTLQPFQKKKQGWKPGLCWATSFRPALSELPCYGLLLACRLCYNEGVQYYYQYSTVLNATSIDEFQTEAKVAHRPRNEQQTFTVSHVSRGTQKIILAEGITSNVQLVMENTQKTIVDSRVFWIKRLPHFKSLHDVLVKMPRMEWDHWPELQKIILPNTRPSDDQLKLYHAGVLPTNEPPRRFRKGLRQRTHIGKQETMEDELLAIMQLMPQTAFRARIPVTYKYDDEQVWEICEYELRSLKLVSRQRVSSEEIAKEKFPEPEFSDHNYSYYNW